MGRPTMILALLSVVAVAFSATAQNPAADSAAVARMARYFSEVPIGGPSTGSQAEPADPREMDTAPVPPTLPATYVALQNADSTDKEDASSAGPPPSGRDSAKSGLRQKPPVASGEGMIQLPAEEGKTQLPAVIEDNSPPRAKSSRTLAPTRLPEGEPGRLRVPVPDPVDQPIMPSRLEPKTQGPPESNSVDGAPLAPLPGENETLESLEPDAKPKTLRVKPKAPAKTKAPAKVKMPGTVPKGPAFEPGMFDPVPEAPAGETPGTKEMDEEPGMELPDPEGRWAPSVLPPDPAYQPKPTPPKGPRKIEPPVEEPDTGPVWAPDEDVPLVYGHPSWLGEFTRGRLPLGIEARGWLDQGVTINTHSPRDRRNFPVTFNDRSNDYQMNQLYLALMSAIDPEEDRIQLGGQLDLLYGTDHVYATSLGLETFPDGSPKWNSDNGPVGTNYGLAMPQVYLEAFAPIGGGLSIKMGHFYTIMGYEKVPAPANFFYSHAYAFQYGEPITHTGVLAEYGLSPRLKVQAGFTRGWDTWEDNNNDLAFLGGLAWTSDSEDTSLAMTVHTGPEATEPPPRGNVRTNYSLVFKHRFNERFSYVFQHNLGYEPRATVSNRTAYWYGINQYLLYQINPTWAAGLRVEWFHDKSGARLFPGQGLDLGGDYYELTAGLNWTPRERLIVRPEIRWDWAKTDHNPFADGTLDHQFLLAVDAIVTF